MRLRIAIALASLAALSVGIPAYADGLTGSQVTLNIDDPVLGAAIAFPLTATVGPGVEFPTGSAVSTSSTFTVYNPNIDISSDQILLDYTVDGSFNGAGFNGFVFDFANAPTITGVSLDPSSNLPASDVVGLTFTGDQIDVNLQADTVTPSTSILLDVGLSPAVTPEPRSLVLLATGLLGVLALSQRKKLAA
jgi:hypothetical protein